MRVTRRRGLMLRLDPGEDQLLGTLFGDLLELLAEATPGEDADPVIARLYPDAYGDAGASEEFRALTVTSQRDERAARIRACAREVAEHKPDIALDDEAADRWIRVLNDLRLALGTRLGISDEWDHGVDPDDPQQLPQATYVWLTGAQDLLVRTLMR
jgi:hypothetical protein